MNKILAPFCLVVLCCYLTEAATKNEVNQAITAAGNAIRRDGVLDIQSRAAQALGSAALPSQRACINRQRALALRDLNAALGAEQTALRKEYGLKTPQELESLDLSSASDEIAQRLRDAVAAKQGVSQQC